MAQNNIGTEVANINYTKMGYEYSAQIKFRTVNGDKDKIILDIAVISSAHKVFVLQQIILRTKKETTITLINDKYGIISDTGQNFTFTGSGMEAVSDSYILNDDEINDIQSGVDMLRISLKEGFLNLKITEKESKKIVDILNELLTFASSK